MERITKLINNIGSRGERPQTVFDDWMTMYSIAIRNSSSLHDSNWQRRERIYLDTIGKYRKEDQGKFSQLCALLVELLSEERRDVLGPIYESLGMGSARLGQFFTPAAVSRVMAEITMDKKSISKDIEAKGYVSLNEPTCGSGTALIEAVNYVKEQGFNPQQQMLISAQDVSLIAVQMRYVQLSLLGIPTECYHMDTIKLEVFDVYETPFYRLFGWHYKRRSEQVNQALNREPEVTEVETIKPQPELQLGLF